MAATITINHAADCLMPAPDADVVSCAVVPEDEDEAESLSEFVVGSDVPPDEEDVVAALPRQGSGPTPLR